MQWNLLEINKEEVMFLFGIGYKDLVHTRFIAKEKKAVCSIHYMDKKVLFKLVTKIFVRYGFALNQSTNLYLEYTYLRR